ncbi:MAG: hypothetical protein ACPGTU_02700 [Myxococcota bacterium]
MPTQQRFFYSFTFLLSLSACGDGGAGSCVVFSSIQDGWESCYDDYTEEECDEKGDDLDEGVEHASSSCDSRGYTVQCEGEYGYRLPSYGC